VSDVPSFDLTQTDRLLTTTRAVRKRIDLNRPVEESVITDCLRVATQAPTGSNAQRWRWVVITDPAKKQAVGAYYAKSFAAYMAPKEALISPDDTTRLRMTGSASYLAEHVGDVPVLVVPCVLDRPPTGAGEELAVRRPVEEVTYWNTWKETRP